MSWLKDQRLEKFAQGLADFGVEIMDDLQSPFLTDADLKGMGMKELHIRKFRAP